MLLNDMRSQHSCDPFKTKLFFRSRRVRIRSTSQSFKSGSFRMAKKKLKQVLKRSHNNNKQQQRVAVAEATKTKEVKITLGGRPARPKSACFAPVQFCFAPIVKPTVCSTTTVVILHNQDSTR
ncbi:hypothetical protein ACSBR1_015577 [Camellia fascicularis]